MGNIRQKCILGLNRQVRTPQRLGKQPLLLCLLPLSLISGLSNKYIEDIPYSFILNIMPVILHQDYSPIPALNPILHKIQIKLILKNLPFDALIHFVPIFRMNNTPKSIASQLTKFLSCLALKNIEQALVYIYKLPVAFCKID